jgi:hypothetical protein
VAASRRQRLGLEHHDYVVDAPGKESGGGAHRGCRCRWGGVLVEGGSDGVAAASGVVLRLEAKVWGELRALHRSGWGVFSDRRWVAAPF